MPPPTIPTDLPEFASVGTQVTAPTAPQKTDGFSPTEPINKYTLHWLFWNIWSWLVALSYFLFTDPGREHGFNAAAWRTTTGAANPSYNGLIWIFSSAGSLYADLSFLRPGDVITNFKWVYDSGAADVTVYISKRPYTGAGDTTVFTTTDVTHGGLAAHDTTPNVIIEAGYSYRLRVDQSAGSFVSGHMWITHPALV